MGEKLTVPYSLTWSDVLDDCRPNAAVLSGIVAIGGNAVRVLTAKSEVVIRVSFVTGHSFFLHPIRDRPVTVAIVSSKQLVCFLIVDELFFCWIKLQADAKPDSDICKVSQGC